MSVATTHAVAGERLGSPLSTWLGVTQAWLRSHPPLPTYVACTLWTLAREAGSPVSGRDSVAQPSPEDLLTWPGERTFHSTAFSATVICYYCTMRHLVSYHKAMLF